MSAEEVEAVRGLLGAEITSGVGAAMMCKFGGVERCLARYVRYAGAGEPAAAAVRATVAFRTEHNVDEIEARITENGTLDLVGPLWFSAFNPNCSPDGSPILYYKAEVVDGGRIVASCTEEQFRDFYLYWMEKGLAMQVASINAGAEPAGVIEIYDIANVGISQLHISGMMLLSRVLGLGQLHYPENLAKGYLINAPWWISQGYSLITPVLSQATVDALSISSDDCREDLLTHMSEEEHTAMLASVVAPPPEYPVDEDGLSVRTLLKALYRGGCSFLRFLRACL